MGREMLVEVIERVSLSLMSHYVDRRESVIPCKNILPSWPWTPDGGREEKIRIEKRPRITITKKKKEVKVVITRENALNFLSCFCKRGEKKR